MTFSIIQSIVSLFAEGLRTYRQRQRQRSLEKRLATLRKAYSKLKGDYDTCTEHDQKTADKLAKLEEQYKLLQHTYGALLQAEMFRDIADDKRSVDPNPY